MLHLWNWPILLNRIEQHEVTIRCGTRRTPKQNDIFYGPILLRVVLGKMYNIEMKGEGTLNKKQRQRSTKQ